MRILLLKASDSSFKKYISTDCLCKLFLYYPNLVFISSFDVDVYPWVTKDDDVDYIVIIYDDYLE